MTIKTKFNIEDTCWFILNEVYYKAIVEKIDIRCNKKSTGINYTLNYIFDNQKYETFHNEKELFKTKKEACEAIIKRIDNEA